MNPVLSFLMVLILGLEITFTNVIPINIIIMLICLIIVLTNHPSKKIIYALIFSPLLPAIGTYIAQRTFGSPFKGEVLATRIYAYIFLGAAFIQVNNSRQFAMTLEQTFKVPTKVVYGVYGAMNLFGKVQVAINEIRSAALMRGTYLSFWSPKLYFKAILKTWRWSDNLTKAMFSHGFVEDAPRTHLEQIKIPLIQYIIVGIVILLIPITLLLL